MKEIRTGIHHALAMPWLYDSFQKMVGAYKWRQKVLTEFIIPALPEYGSLVDIGCGTGEVLNYLPNNINYIGFDRNKSYIQQAQQKHQSRNAKFYCEELSSNFLTKDKPADVVLALGLIHHLDDEQTIALFNLARSIMSCDGFLLTLDPLYSSKQSNLARYIISKDRGMAVRTEAAYKELSSQVFSQVDVYVNHNPLFIPYTGIVMICRD